MKYEHGITGLIQQRNRRLRKPEVVIPVTYARSLGYTTQEYVDFTHIIKQAEKEYQEKPKENIQDMKIEDNQLDFRTWKNPFLQFSYANYSKDERKENISEPCS